MVQAKRKARSKAVANQAQSFQGLGILLIGMAIGVLATMLWQGMRATDGRGADGGIGAGIIELMKQSNQPDPKTTTDQVASEPETPVTPKTTFDFFTVLPEIEVVVPTIEDDSASSIPQENLLDPPTDNATEVGDVADVTEAGDAANASNASSYMLQAGSYKNKDDADRLKAELAFQGLTSVIQKISIQDRGHFYRVRLGPYSSYDQMVTIDQKLTQQKIKTLRLKISKGR